MPADGAADVASGASVELRSLTKRYGHTTAVADVSLNIEPGEFVSLLGPSGSGKTTTLLMVAGFATPTEGHILVAGTDITYLPPHRRNMGMVYQNYALFPHMNVYRNVAFPLRMRGLAKDEIRARVERALAIVRLEGMEGRLPAELSGGQQQRVALARAMVFRPPLLLMDEPLGALDKKLRDELQIEIKRIQRETRNTVIYVTHDQDEALNMSDRIVVMNHGRIEQVGTPLSLYERPSSAFVADFMGGLNIHDATVVESRGQLLARTELGTEIELPDASGLTTGAKLKVTIRPERINVQIGSSTARGTLAGRITEADYFGNSHRFQIRLATHDVLWAVCGSTGHAPFPRGADVNVSWATKDVWIIPELSNT
jgi:spermidine/putrescine ABC transporter ATP-binding subunit